jgi:hypothetical protein
MRFYSFYSSYIRTFRCALISLFFIGYDLREERVPLASFSSEDFYGRKNFVSKFSETDRPRFRAVALAIPPACLNEFSHNHTVNKHAPACSGDIESLDDWRNTCVLQMCGTDGAACEKTASPRSPTISIPSLRTKALRNACISAGFDRFIPQVGINSCKNTGFSFHKPVLREK